MRLQPTTSSSPVSWGSLFLSTLLFTACPIRAKSDGPSVKTTSLENPPMALSYFDDSDVLLFQDWETNNVWRSSDAGETWAVIDDIPGGEAWSLYMHPFDNKVAYVLSEARNHWKTSDRGQSWETFRTEAGPSSYRAALSFHADDEDRIIFNGQDCTGLFCQEMSMYTTDGFRTDSKVLRMGTMGCNWAKSTPQFTTGDKDQDKDRILCVSKAKDSWWYTDYRLVISDDFFMADGDDVIQEFEPELEPGKTVIGLTEMAAVKGYLVAAAKAKGTDEMALYVSDDTKRWHRAVFPKDHRLDENAYTILESTNYSIQIDVLTTRNSNPMGILLSSNSNGTYFTRLLEHTNRNTMGFVDFEKMSGVQGIVLANVVDNWEDAETDSDKKIKSQISFDDGRTWQSLKVKDGDKDLHLHSVTDMHNSGKVFSSPAPGLVMGVGNTGSSLKEYAEGDTYVSDDAGVTWTKALDGPHKYEFGDSGSILVAVSDNGEKTKKLKYSINHGVDWESYELDEEILPHALTTTADSTSLKFIMTGTEDEDSEKYSITAISFEGLHERKCGDKDMEKWYARVDEDGKPTCLMGHKQYYNRRKKDADCFVKQEFKDPVAELEPCECTDADFECDFNFVRSSDRKECVRGEGMKYIIPDGQCESFDKDTTFKGSSGWRLIPGDDCKRPSGTQKDDPVERKCSEVGLKPPADGKIKHTVSDFKTSQNTFSQKYYFERTDTSNGDDESIVMLIGRSVYLSKDSGKTWKEILEDETIEGMQPHPYFNDIVYFISDNARVFYTMDRGDSIHSFKGPHLPQQDVGTVMNFHESNKDWIIWTGEDDCGAGGDCHLVSSITTDRGDNWKTLQRYVRRCEFIKQNPPQQRAEKLIYCTKKKKESLSDEGDNDWQLISSPDFFETDKETIVHFDDIVDFATMSEFIVVAAHTGEKRELRVDASIDGTVFAEAHFPFNFQASAYTVLDSSTHSVFLHVTTEQARGEEYGAIVKSNSNGTSYVLSISNVNRDQYGYVDFEKMYGLDGVALVNVVSNAETAVSDGKKVLKSVITHNDGAEWRYIRAPAQNFDGKSYDCGGDCGLHLHSYTERRDKDHTFASAQAVGLMMATGNVGESLSKPSEADTFITTNAGIDWKPVKQGAHMWCYGDQGAIIVIAPEPTTKTKSIYYSRDEGDTWVEYEFSESEVNVLDVTTVPSTASRNFAVWTSTDNGLAVVNVDFTGLTDRMCNFNDKQPENEDYYLWSPKHPTQDNDCLFGHISQYHRKKTSADCYNPSIPEKIHNILRNCTCTRQDFECDYNYEVKADGSCQLVTGLPPPNHAESCSANPDQTEYFEPSGYRRIPLTTCQGGQELEYIGQPKPCPGKEDEFQKKHGIGAFGIFLAVTIPIAAAVGVGYWVWQNWQHRGFGQIRLGEQSSYDDQAPYVKYPVMVVSAVVAVALTLPALFAAGWQEISKMLRRRRGYSNRFTTRGSFGRESDYAVVDEDEGELLGDESDEDV